MDKTTYRLMFSAIALVPATATYGLALMDSALLSTSLLTFACGLVALSAALHPALEFSAPVQAMKGPGALSSSPSKMPSRPQQLSTVQRALAHAVDPIEESTPLTREQAIAWVLRKVLSAWRASDLSSLSSERLLTAFLMLRLLSTTPGEAGRLAGHFRRPDAVLSIRDEIDRLTRERADWDRNNRLFLATQWIWTRQSHEPKRTRLIETLAELGPPDIDLWHRVVLEHDPADADQRAAALWCLTQPSCDRATVAAYLAQIALDGRLVAAAKRGRKDDLAAIRSIIENWNADHYRTQVLGLDPENGIARQGDRITQAFDRLEELTRVSWPRPRGAFTDYRGRPPRLRLAWDLRSGWLHEAPRREDYFEAPTLPQFQNHLL